MTRPGFQRFAAIAAAACVSLTALGLAGCGSAQKTLPTLEIAIAMPTRGELAGRGSDMYDAAKLALMQTNFDTPDHELKLVAAAKAGPSPTAVINALAEDHLAAQDILRVNLSIPPVKRPANTIWLLPSGFTEGQAVGQFIASGGVVSAGFIPGSSAAAAVQAGYASVLRRSGIAATGSPANHPKLPLSVGYSGVNAASADDPTTPGTPPGTFVTPALSPSSYPPSGKRFFKSFKDEFGHEPDRYAIFGYEAAGLIVDAIQRAEKAQEAFTAATGDPNSTASYAALNWSQVVHKSAFSIKNRFGPTGHYDVLPNGSTSNYVFQARGEDAPPEDASIIEVQR
jgi:hypothetical protein